MPWQQPDAPGPLRAMGCGWPRARRFPAAPPHLLSSPLASLCFSLKAARSARGKPSWAVMKLTECRGSRPPRHSAPPWCPTCWPPPLPSGPSTHAVDSISCSTWIHVAGAHQK